MQALLYIGAAQSLFFILFLLSKSKKNTGDILLIFWMLFLALPMVTGLIFPEGYNLRVVLTQHKLPYGFTYGPVLLLYTYYITGKKIDINQCIMHFMPFSLAVIYKVLFVPELSFNPNLDPDNTLLGNILAASTLASSIGYALVTINWLKKHRLAVLNQFSSVSEAITLRWLKWLAISVIIFCIQPFIFMMLSFPEILHTRLFALLTLMFVLSFFGLKQQQIYIETKKETRSVHSKIYPAARMESLDFQISNFMPVSGHPLSEAQSSLIAAEADKIPETLPPKYERSGLTDDKAQKLLFQLRNFMEEDKPYLDSELTVDKLANQMSISRHHLTQIFSEQLNKNFYLFINEYRVNEVKLLMKDPCFRSKTLLDIAYRCGFNSKPTFNRAFKAITNMTPSQYRKVSQKSYSLQESSIKKLKDTEHSVTECQLG